MAFKGKAAAATSAAATGTPSGTVAPIWSADFYVAAASIPEGNYVIFNKFQMFKPDRDPIGTEKLCYMLTAHSMADLKAPPRTKAISLGKEAHKSWAPNPADGGMTLVPRAGAKAEPLNNETNWNYFHKSILKAHPDLGAILNVTNSIAPLNGAWVHLTNEAEPESRKDMGKNKRNTTGTGEAAIAAAAAAGTVVGGVPQEDRRNNTVLVISEFLPGGESWAGGGGLPKAGQKLPGAGKAVAPKAVAKPEPEAEVENEAGIDDLDLEAISTKALHGVLMKKPTGGPALGIYGAAFTAIQKAYGDAAAQTIQDDLFGDLEATNEVLAKMGYTSDGATVSVIAD